MNLSSEIASYLKKQLFGKDFFIEKFGSIGSVSNKTICFINKKNYKFNQSVEALIIAI